MEPAWAALLPAQYTIGRRGEDESSSDDPSWDAREAWDPVAIYGRAQVLNESVDPIDGPRIRLLQIQPDAYGRPVHAELISRPLFDAPAYTALSYSWGLAKSFEKKISIGRADVRVPVSRHLYQALQRIRDTRRVIHLWVDAICINQGNLLDKATQVQIMAQIYSEAQEVKIWLGEVANPGDDLMLFRSFCQQIRPWWTRLWIIQECAYATKCPVVMFGDSTLSLEELVRRWYRVTTLDTLSTYQRRMLEKNLRLLSVPYEAWAQAGKNGGKRSLLSRLRETRGRHCTDPRDRIYALLSLVVDSEARRIQPDYRKGYAELRAEAEELLEQSESWNQQQDQNLLSLDLPDGAMVFQADLQQACYEDDEPLIQHLIISNAGHLPILSEHFEPAMEGALRRDNVGVVKLLVDLGADVNGPRGDSGHVLCIASARSDEDTVKLLLDAGAKVNAPRGESSDALYTASGRGRLRVAEILLHAGATADHYALCYATIGGFAGTVKLLLDAGAPTDLSDDEHRKVISVLYKESMVETDIGIRGPVWWNRVFFLLRSQLFTLEETRREMAKELQNLGISYDDRLGTSSKEYLRRVLDAVTGFKDGYS